MTLDKSQRYDYIFVIYLLEDKTPIVMKYDSSYSYCLKRFNSIHLINVYQLAIKVSVISTIDSIHTTDTILRMRCIPDISQYVFATNLKNDASKPRMGEIWAVYCEFLVWTKFQIYPCRIVFSIEFILPRYWELSVYFVQYHAHYSKIRNKPILQMPPVHTLTYSKYLSFTCQIGQVIVRCVRQSWALEFCNKLIKLPEHSHLHENPRDLCIHFQQV